MSFTSAANVVSFCLAGHATVTIQSHKTETHYTFQIKRNKRRQNGGYFVSLLTGPEQYAYMGMITRDRDFIHTKGSKIDHDAKSSRSFRWFWHWMTVRQQIPELLEIRHDGHCARCGRQLTTPESIDRGLGPECAIKEGVASAPKKRQVKSATVYEFPAAIQTSPHWLG